MNPGDLSTTLSTSDPAPSSHMGATTDGRHFFLSRICKQTFTNSD
jgi:hypothetical protein